MLDRSWYAPGHVTAGAVVVYGNSVLMVHHRHLGVWIPPGGHVDADDANVAAAAARELVEETGVSARLVGSGAFDTDAHFIPGRPDEREHVHFNVSYLFEADSDTIVANSEVHDARFVPFAEAISMRPGGAVQRVVEKLQAS